MIFIMGEELACEDGWSCFKKMVMTQMKFDCNCPVYDPPKEHWVGMCHLCPFAPDFEDDNVKCQYPRLISLQGEEG